MNPVERPYSPSSGIHAGQRRTRNIWCVYGMGPHAERVIPLLRTLREACARCNGEGLLAAGRHIRECPTCEGAGGVWTGDDATIIATIHFLMTAYPDVYKGPNGRLHEVVGERPYEPPPEVTP